MKKLVIATALLAAGIASADIVSSSIVGYQTVEAPSGNFVILAVQFEGVGESSEIAVKDLVSYSDPAGGLSIGVGADQIWRWNAIKMDWDKYFYRKGRNVTVPGWCKADTTEITSDTIKAGESAFFFRGGSTATTLTLAGGVKPFTGSASYTVLSGNFATIAYPWPASLAINDMTNAYEEGDPSGGLSIGVGADQIWRWNATKMDWDKYFYRKGRNVTTPGWCKADTTEITKDTIPAGEGFFFFRGGSTDVTITYSYPSAE